MNSTSITSMRIFVGIPASSDFRANTCLWQESRRDMPFRFVDERDLHLTIIPPWEVDDIEVEKKKIQQLAELSACKLHINRVFPNASRGGRQTIWAISDEAPVELRVLRVKAHDVFNREIEIRPFSPHVTLARTGQDVIFRKFEDSVNWEFPINRVALFISHLTPDGSWYEIAQEVKLNL